LGGIVGTISWPRRERIDELVERVLGSRVATYAVADGSAAIFRFGIAERPPGAVAVDFETIGVDAHEILAR